MSRGEASRDSILLPLFSFYPPSSPQKIVKLCFSQATRKNKRKRKKKKKVNPCLSSVTANFAVNRNYTPPHTHTCTVWSQTHRGATAEQLRRVTQKPAESTHWICRGFPRGHLGCSALTAQVELVIHGYSIILLSPQMKMPKGDLWLLLPN